MKVFSSLEGLEKEEKCDSTVEPQNTEGLLEEDPFGPKCFYNKSKSFFDNISSDMKSRYDCEECRCVECV